MNDGPDGLRRRKRRPKPGDIAALRRILWQATLELEKLLEKESVEVKLRTASALATTAGVYLKAIEASDFEKRILELEKRVGEEN